MLNTMDKSVKRFAFWSSEAYARHGSFFWKDSNGKAGAIYLTSPSSFAASTIMNYQGTGKIQLFS